jgi:hypothetical protein
MNAPLERHKAIREARIAAGLCATCGKVPPRDKNSRDCQECRDRINKRVRKTQNPEPYGHIVRPDHEEDLVDLSPEADIWSAPEDGLDRALRSADEALAIA